MNITINETKRAQKHNIVLLPISTSTINKNLGENYTKTHTIRQLVTEIIETRLKWQIIKKKSATEQKENNKLNLIAESLGISRQELDDKITTKEAEKNKTTTTKT